MNREAPVTPEWLLARNFVAAIPGEGGPTFGAWDFDYPVNEGETLYLENNCCRSQFAIILGPNEFSNGVQYYDYTLLIRYDIGCGFVEIPLQWSELSQHCLNLLWEAVKGEPLVISVIPIKGWVNELKQLPFPIMQLDANSTT